MIIWNITYSVIQYSVLFFLSFKILQSHNTEMIYFSLSCEIYFSVISSEVPPPHLVEQLYRQTRYTAMATTCALSQALSQWYRHLVRGHLAPSCLKNRCGAALSLFCNWQKYVSCLTAAHTSLLSQCEFIQFKPPETWSPTEINVIFDIPIFRINQHL